MDAYLTSATPSSNVFEFEYSNPTAWPVPTSLTGATLEGLTGLAQITTARPHALQSGETIQVSGAGSGYNGVFTVAQISTPTTFEYSYAAPAALSPATSGTLNSAALQPVRLSTITGGNITIDEILINISAKLIVYATDGDSPGGLPLPGNGVSPSDPTTPPFSNSANPPNGVFDIVEFAYEPVGATQKTGEVVTISTTQPHGFSVNESVTLSDINNLSGKGTSPFNGTWTVTAVPSPMTFQFQISTMGGGDGGSGFAQKTGSLAQVTISNGFSTFDLSAVDGLAIPMRLEGSQVKKSMVNGKLTLIDSIGIRKGISITRPAIAQAFKKFMQTDPLGHSSTGNGASRDFGKLLYAGEVDLSSIAITSASWSNNVATFSYSGSSIVANQTVKINDFTTPYAGYNGTYIVQTAASNQFTVTNTNNTLQPTTTGGRAAPVVFQAPPQVDSPPQVDNQFYTIAAPKDWLGNQDSSMAANDSLATFWNKTSNKFFKDGNYLSIYLGKDSAHPTYSGTSDGTKYTLSNGLNSYSFYKPAGGLAAAIYVWSQVFQTTPSGDEGLLQDQIWMALARGVALDGVSKTPIINNQSTTAWVDSTQWYSQHPSTAFPTFQSVYCPYSRFLHNSDINGGTSGDSIFLHNAAYGFGEDENPIGNPYGGPLVPSKFDGTIYDNSTLTLTLVSWSTPSPQAPTVVSIDTGMLTPTTAANVTWTVRFSEPVSGVQASNFTLVPSVGLAGTSITSVVANGIAALSQTWTVTANTGTGTGTLGLNLTSDGSIVDASNTSLSLPVGGFTGQVYSVRPNPVGPTIAIAIAISGTNPTDATTVPFAITFSQTVTGLTAANFTTVASGGVMGSSVRSVSGSGASYTVTVNTGTGSGTLALRLATSASVLPEVTGLPVTSLPYTIDKNDPTASPTVHSIALSGASPTAAASVSWTVTFSEPVTGLTALNFQLVAEVLGATPTITGVTPVSGTITATWTVTASTGTGSGTLGLNMTNSTNVRDANSQAVTNVPFTGDIYTIDRAAPTLQSITLTDVNPTQQPQVSWTVTFSEAVSGVSKANFRLVSTGLSGSQITQVMQAGGSGATWTVTAFTGSGSGTLQLNMVNATGITDAVGLAPTGIPLAGQAYQIQRGGATIVAVPISFMTTVGTASKLVWLMPAFTDSDSVSLTAALSVSPASGGTLRATSRAGVTVTPSGTPSAELQFAGTVAALNAYFRNRLGLISYTPSAGALAPRTLTLSAQGSDGLSGLATAAVLVRAAARQSPAPAVNQTASLAGTAGQPVVITYAQLVIATGATQTTSRSIQFMFAGLSAGRLEVWTGSRWAVVPSLVGIPLLVPGGQIRWKPPINGLGVTQAFSVKTWDGWQMSSISRVAVNLAR